MKLQFNYYLILIRTFLKIPDYQDKIRSYTTNFVSTFDLISSRLLLICRTLLRMNVPPPLHGSVILHSEISGSGGIHIDSDPFPLSFSPESSISCSGAAPQSEGRSVNFCSRSGRETKFPRRYSEYI